MCKLKNILKTIGILLLVIVIMILILGTIQLIFFFIRPLFWVLCGIILMILIWVIWEGVTNY
jgi:hypothetical protein